MIVAVSQPTSSLSVEPFTIHVPDEVLEDLRARLRNTRWPDPAPGPAWDQGTDLEYLKEVCAYWAEEFDWRGKGGGVNGVHHRPPPPPGCISGQPGTESAPPHGGGAKMRAPATDFL